MFSPNKKSNQFITLEGCPETLKIAQSIHQSLNVHIDCRLGHFDDTLGAALNDLTKIDCVYIDGNHTYEATLKYTSMPYSYI